LKAGSKIRCVIGVAFLLLVSVLCPQAHASHIQYVDLANVSGVNIGNNITWTWHFDLTIDSMYLWEINSPTTTFGPTPDVNTADFMGSYDPDYDLHYVTLKIDPNNYTGNPTSDYIELKVNDIVIGDWANPISLYDWGIPNGSVSDVYGIVASDYKITVSLTGLSNNSISITNVNLEGCFDSATPVPEPTTMLLLGSGLMGLAGFRRKTKKG
jgi:hypothetical protein